ncbi:CpsD/CapB family tyrosine-protein kinase [Bacillus massiliigorillae]|uniref:CpsD/CapB family tyrosine-protein kinase n=1 Tax=Bacillus massiliigorillae TaxID=1243664 RepID=UPI0003A1CC7D|nr:CpsD/CapB family tyrosine-protein kinase [Bacillus massiliigorillae]
MFNKQKKKSTVNRNKKLIASLSPKSPISEQYRTIRTNIQFASIDYEIQSIMVTSAEPGAGKSTTSANLAVVFAQQGKRVLIIDSDLRKPTLHHIFKVHNNDGLTSVLMKSKQLEEVIVPTNEPNVFLLTSGPIPPNPAELLISKAMKFIYNKVIHEYDLVIFDTPPILAVTDSQIVSHYCDGTIIVVASEQTKKEQLKKGIELLNFSKARIVGTVLNNKKLSNHDNHYYYYS